MHFRQIDADTKRSVLLPYKAEKRIIRMAILHQFERCRTVGHKVLHEPIDGIISKRVLEVNTTLRPDQGEAGHLVGLWWRLSAIDYHVTEIAIDPPGKAFVDKQLKAATQPDRL